MKLPALLAPADRVVHAGRAPSLAPGGPAHADVPVLDRPQGEHDPTLGHGWGHRARCGPEAIASDLPDLCLCLCCAGQRSFRGSDADHDEWAAKSV